MTVKDKKKKKVELFTIAGSEIVVNKVQPELQQFAYDLIKETKCKIVLEEWHSNYNSYVVYDYEPFCADGFTHKITLGARTENDLNFFMHLFKERVEAVQHLNKCLEV